MAIDQLGSIRWIDAPAVFFSFSPSLAVQGSIGSRRLVDNPRVRKLLAMRKDAQTTELRISERTASMQKRGHA